jgi:transcriptional regulator with XRE-family HTH domain
MSIPILTRECSISSRLGIRVPRRRTLSSARSSSRVCWSKRKQRRSPRQGVTEGRGEDAVQKGGHTRRSGKEAVRNHMKADSNSGRIVMATKKYHNVSEMLADSAPTEEFRQEFETQVAKRRVIKHLIALRTAKGLSQKDIADQVNCSQSRISKLEHGVDDDIRLGDLRAYARSLGFSTGFVFSDQKMTAVEEVKHHAFCIKRLMDRLAQLAGRDEKIAQAVSAFFGEAFFNLVTMIQDSASKLPLRPDDDSPYIRIEVAAGGPDQITLEADCDSMAEGPRELVAK